MNGCYCDRGKDIEIPGDQIEQNFKKKNEEIKKVNGFSAVSVSHNIWDEQQKSRSRQHWWKVEKVIS